MMCISKVSIGCRNRNSPVTGKLVIRFNERPIWYFIITSSLSALLSPQVYTQELILLEIHLNARTLIAINWTIEV